MHYGLIKEPKLRISLMLTICFLVIL